MCEFFHCLPSEIDNEDLDRMLGIMGSHSLYEERVLAKQQRKGK